MLHIAVTSILTKSDLGRKKVSLSYNSNVTLLMAEFQAGIPGLTRCSLTCFPWLVWPAFLQSPGLPAQRLYLHSLHSHLEVENREKNHVKTLPCHSLRVQFNSYLHSVYIVALIQKLLFKKMPLRLAWRRAPVMEEVITQLWSTLHRWL